jgi:SRSO17 transposase
LYLPKSWTDDKERCLRAGIPDEFIVYQRKEDLAIQAVLSARMRGAEFEWVGCDALYGSDPFFLRFLDDIGETFVADVHKDQRVYLDDPTPYIPEPKPIYGA